MKTPTTTRSRKRRRTVALAPQRSRRRGSSTPRQDPALPLDRFISEKEFQARILAVAGYLHWLAYHTYDSRKCVPGFPDLVLVRPPRTLFVELKKETGRVSKAQTTWLASLSGCPGVETYTWRPSMWEEIVALLT